MTLVGRSVGAPYCGWRVWPEPDLAGEVESLVRRGEPDAALRLIFPGAGEIES
jgi:hypothetical protein